MKTIEPPIGLVVVEELLGFWVPLQWPAQVDADSSQQANARRAMGHL